MHRPVERISRRLPYPCAVATPGRVSVCASHTKRYCPLPEEAARHPSRRGVSECPRCLCWSAGMGPPPAIQQHITRSERAHSLWRRGEMGLSRLKPLRAAARPRALKYQRHCCWCSSSGSSEYPPCIQRVGAKMMLERGAWPSSHVVVILITSIVSRPVPIPVADATGQRPAERGRRWRPLADSKGPQRAVSADPSDCDWAKASHTSLGGGRRDGL